MTKPQSNKKGDKKSAKRQAPRSRRPPMPRAGTKYYELSVATLGEAALELLRLAVEYEQRHQPVELRLDASDRKIRRAVQELTGADATLEEVINVVLRYRDHRQEMVKQVRTAQALGEIVAFYKKRSAELRVAQDERKKDGSLRGSLGDSTSFKRELAEYVRQRFGLWEVPLPEELVPEIVTEALSHPKFGDGLWRRLADVVSSKVTMVKGASLERTYAALGGRAQQTGRFRNPEHAKRALDHEPVGGTEAVEYLLRRLAARGIPDHVVHKVLDTWKQELFLIVHGAIKSAGSSPEGP